VAEVSNYLHFNGHFSA